MKTIEARSASPGQASRQKVTNRNNPCRRPWALRLPIAHQPSDRPPGLTAFPTHHEYRHLSAERSFERGTDGQPASNAALPRRSADLARKR